jgi:hypothetical protein
MSKTNTTKMTPSQQNAIKWLEAQDGMDATVIRIWEEDGTVDIHTYEDLAYHIARRGQIESF